MLTIRRSLGTVVGVVAGGIRVASAVTSFTPPGRMRVIVVGCEYSGQTTLVNKLSEWGTNGPVRYPPGSLPPTPIPDAAHWWPSGPAPSSLLRVASDFHPDRRMGLQGRHQGFMFHMDDHFTIPDAYHLEAEEQQGMMDMLPAIKERYQRFQVRSSPRRSN